MFSATEGENSLTRNLLLSIADNFSRQLSEVSRDGMRQTALAGYSTGGRPPFGYRAQEVVDPDKRDRQGQPVRKTLWVVEVSEAGVVIRIFHLYLEGLGFKRIAMALNADGIPGPRGGSWAPSAIREMLRNPTYTGARVFGRNRKVRLQTGGAPSGPGRPPSGRWRRTRIPPSCPPTSGSGCRRLSPGRPVRRTPRSLPRAAPGRARRWSAW